MEIQIIMTTLIATFIIERVSGKERVWDRVGIFGVYSRIGLQLNAKVNHAAEHDRWHHSTQKFTKYPPGFVACTYDEVILTYASNSFRIRERVTKVARAARSG